MHISRILLLSSCVLFSGATYANTASGAMLMASTGIVAVQEQYPPGPNLYYRQDGLYEYRSVAPNLVPSRADRWRFHHSGTRGRIGLGADPVHPEGPGNVLE
jgi:hypothetical protein